MLLTFVVPVNAYDGSLAGVAGSGAFFGSLAFGIAAALHWSRTFERGAGILAFAGSVATVAVLTVVGGMTAPHRLLTRTGLTMLGGFVAAALILAANAVVKVFG